ncbi:MAG: hypothetical protein K2Q20_01850 [Phycisphaerales bacterium]|nr:hypothetical protein [Phycisphaerales bacterium]
MSSIACTRLHTDDPIDRQLAVINDRFTSGMSKDRAMAEIERLHVSERSASTEWEFDPTGQTNPKPFEVVRICSPRVLNLGMSVSQDQISFWFDEQDTLSEIWVVERGGAWRRANQDVLKAVGLADDDWIGPSADSIDGYRSRRGTLRLLPLALKIREVLDQRGDGGAN